LPYCGAPPLPGELLDRFNLDPVLIAVLLVMAICHVGVARKSRNGIFAVAGWLAAGAALLSPLCALSVALFCARVAQHMLLLLVAAPLLALALPRIPPRRGAGRMLWTMTAAFFAALWFWHMPVPYDATFAATWIYWLMHVTLFGSAILLWRELLHHRAEQTANALAAGAISFMHMGLLGAVLTFADRPLFMAHLTTAAAWNFTPLQDQQLGGVFMWVPGTALFLWTAVRSLGRLWATLDRARAI